jgi:NAD(P)-dependent dehydrogenase (short-subunit alcohol dehydrogenase family)
MPSTDRFSLEGLTAVVTGAAGAVGTALVVELVGRGVRVIALDLADTIVERARALGATGRAVDVCDEDAVTAILAELAGESGVDILVNNAGINDRAAPFDVRMDTWDRIMNVNLRGYFVVARAVARLQVGLGRGASIVNVSSTAATASLGRGNLVYGLSKAGVNQLTRELAVEWAADGIRVNAVQPAQIATPAWEAARENPEMAAIYDQVIAGIPLRRLLDPEELVGPILFFASPAASFVTGTVLPVDGGNLALNPAGTVPGPTTASDPVDTRRTPS